MEQLRETNEDLNKRNKRLLVALESVESVNEELNNKLTELQGKNEKLQEQNKELEANNTKITEEYTKQLQEQAKQHELTVSDLTGQIEQLRATLSDREKGFEQTIEGLNQQFNKTLAQMEQANEKQKAVIAKYLADLEEAQESVATLRTQSDSFKLALDQQQQEHDTYVNELMVDLHDQQVAMERLQGEKTGICQALKDLYTMGLTVKVQPRDNQDIQIIRRNLDVIEGSLNHECGLHSTPVVESVGASVKASP